MLLKHHQCLCAVAAGTSQRLHITATLGAQKPRKIRYDFQPLNPTEVIEKNVTGSGPGGSKVNKSKNAIFVKHIPTGVHLKVHEHREIGKNRELAWQKLTELVDEQVNGEDSYLAQVRRAELDYREQIAREKEERKAKLEMKKYYDELWKKKQEDETGDENESLQNESQGSTNSEAPASEKK